MKKPNRTTLFNRSFTLPTLVLGALTAFVVFTANAGMDKNPVVETPPPPFDWTGFYIGGNIGGILSENEFEGRGGDTEGHLFSDVDLGQQFGDEFAGLAIFRFTDQFDKNRPNREDFISAVMGGGQVGYQHQFGHWVVGIEGDFDRTSIRNQQNFRDSTFRLDNDLLGAAAERFDGIVIVDEKGLFLGANSDFLGRRFVNTNWQASVRGKFGYATGRLLFYGTGGVAFAQVDAWAHDVATTFFTLEESINNKVARLNAPSQFQGVQNFRVVNTNIEKDDAVLVGWTAGAGIEVAFNDAVSLALEYRHNDFGDETFDFNGSGNDHNSSHGPIFSGDTNIAFSSDQVTVKLNILLCHMFGHGAYASASPATNNVAIKSPFGGKESVQVGYTKAADADKWSAKEVTKVEEPFNWTGFYVGGNIGGTWTDYDFSHYDADVNVTPIFEDFFPINFNKSAARPDAPSGDMLPDSFAVFSVPSIDGGSDDSIIGGGQVGYQHQFGHFVVGVEADFSGLSTEKHTEFASSDFTFIDEAALSETALFSTRKATVDWNASARLKLGYARGPVMLYVTGGGAWAKVRTWASDFAISDFFVPGLSGQTGAAGVAQPQPIGNLNFSGRASNNTNDEDTVFGWTAGAGAEWAFSKIASIAMEYRHNGFDSAGSHYDPHHTPIAADGYHVDIDSDQVTVKVNLLLGNMGPGH